MKFLCHIFLDKERKMWYNQNCDIFIPMYEKGEYTSMKTKAKRLLSLMLSGILALSQGRILESMARTSTSTAVDAIITSEQSNYGGVFTVEGAYVTDNASDNTYTKWTETTKSYLMADDSDSSQLYSDLLRAEYVEGTGIVVEYYTYDGETGYTTTNSLVIEEALPLWGGLYFGEDAIYVVWGQTNYEEDDTKEVIRIVKYDYEWNEIDTLSLCGINTVEPFEGGTVSMAENDGVLYIHTCHIMYTYTDGYNHQASMILCIDEDSLELTDSFTYLGSFTVNAYVSHSFMQCIKTDGEYIYRLDHGDGSPRGIMLSKTSVDESVSSPEMTEIVYAINNVADGENSNETGVSIGGLAISSSGYVIVGNSVDMEDLDSYDVNGTRNIFVLTEGSDEPIWLTDYSDDDAITVGTPQLIDLQDTTHYLVLWEESDVYGGIWLKAQLIQDGGFVSDCYTFNYRLSDCQPIYTEDGLVTWYVTDGSTVTVYSLNPYELETESILHPYEYQAPGVTLEIESLELTLEEIEELGYVVPVCVSLTENGGLTNFDFSLTLNTMNWKWGSYSFLSSLSKTNSYQLHPVLSSSFSRTSTGLIVELLITIPATAKVGDSYTVTYEESDAVWYNAITGRDYIADNLFTYSNGGVTIVGDEEEPTTEEPEEPTTEETTTTTTTTTTNTTTTTSTTTTTTTSTVTVDGTGESDGGVTAVIDTVEIGICDLDLLDYQVPLTINLTNNAGLTEFKYWITVDDRCEYEIVSYYAYVIMRTGAYPNSIYFSWSNSALMDELKELVYLTITIPEDVMLGDFYSVSFKDFSSIYSVIWYNSYTGINYDTEGLLNLIDGGVSIVDDCSYGGHVSIEIDDIELTLSELEMMDYQVPISVTLTENSGVTNYFFTVDLDGAYDSYDVDFSSYVPMAIVKNNSIWCGFSSDDGFTDTGVLAEIYFTLSKDIAVGDVITISYDETVSAWYAAGEEVSVTITGGSICIVEEPPIVVSIDTVELTLEELEALDYVVPVAVDIKNTVAITTYEFGLAVDQRCGYSIETELIMTNFTDSNSVWLIWASDNYSIQLGTIAIVMLEIPEDATVGDCYDVEYLSSITKNHVWYNCNEGVYYKDSVSWIDGGVTIIEETEPATTTTTTTTMTATTTTTTTDEIEDSTYTYTTDENPIEPDEEPTQSTTEQSTTTTTTTTTTTESTTTTALSYADGVYSAVAYGYDGDVTVTVTIKNGVITAISGSTEESDDWYFDTAKSLIFSAILNTQSTDVDTVSGATISSNAIITAVNACLQQSLTASASTTTTTTTTTMTTTTTTTTTDEIVDPIEPDEEPTQSTTEQSTTTTATTTMTTTTTACEVPIATATTSEGDPIEPITPVEQETTTIYAEVGDCYLVNIDINSYLLSDNEVIAFEDSVITALAEGTARLILTDTGGNIYIIVVIVAEPVVDSKISIDVTSMDTIYATVGEEYIVELGLLSYVILDTRLLSYEDGIITILAEGETEIIFSEVNGMIYVLSFVITARTDEYLLGDVNLDGEVNAGDASEILVYCAKLGAGEDVSNYDESWLLRANFNGDDEINAGDASEVLAYAAILGAG